MKTAFTLICFYAILIGCENNKKIQSPSALLVDSIIINNVEDYNVILNMEYLNKNTFVSFNFNDNTFKKFKSNNTKKFHLVASKSFLKDSTFHSFNKLSDSSFLLIDYNNEHYILDTNLNYYTYSLHQRKKSLSTNFINSGLKYHPVILKDSILISTFYYTQLEDYNKYLKEPSISEYQIKKNEIIENKSYFIKPASLLNYQLPFPRFCFNKNKIILIYPCFDTLYIYDRNTNHISKYNIGNIEFKKPEKWEYNKLATENYNSYNTKYSLKNFKYYSIYYNPNTEHFILYYTSPTSQNTQSPILKALVLDNKYNKIQNYTFSEKIYFETENFIVIPNKGIAMPLFPNNPNKNETNIVYHIYNF